MTKKKPAKKIVRAWGFVLKRGNLVSFWDGSGFQYSIFDTKKDANKWADNICGNPRVLKNLVPLEIRVKTKRKKG